MTDNPPPVHDSGSSGGQEAERVVIRDRRKVDPTTGKARPAGEGSPAGSGPADDAPAESVPAEAGASRGPEAPREPAGSEVVEGEVVEGEVVAGDADGGPGEPDTEVKAPDPAAAEVEQLREQVVKLRAEVDERTSDLRRVSAEYANYRKRVDRDRTLAAEQATGTVLAALLPVLDDLDRAREHGDLVGPFGTVADQLVAALTKFGLTAFGSKGDPFDPTRHEAVAHLTSPEVTEPSCIDVMRRGYLLGDRLLRAAMVAVADPE